MLIGSARNRVKSGQPSIDDNKVDILCELVQNLKQLTRAVTNKYRK